MTIVPVVSITLPVIVVPILIAPRHALLWIKGRFRSLRETDRIDHPHHSYFVELESRNNAPVNNGFVHSHDSIWRVSISAQQIDSLEARNFQIGKRDQENCCRR